MSTRRTDEVIFVSIYLISVILTIVPYIIILMIIKRRQKEFAGSAYKIMFNLGIVDCIQLLAHSFAFIFTMADSTFSYWINKV
uniref:G-protein coupled receptors family 1 profile domain-containing protein n=1 Tax=Acrobeloides nanus TaxID=290746 RepID=A0A914D177_9BILA